MKKKKNRPWFLNLKKKFPAIDNVLFKRLWSYQVLFNVVVQSVLFGNVFKLCRVNTTLQISISVKNCKIFPREFSTLNTFFLNLKRVKVASFLLTMCQNKNGVLFPELGKTLPTKIVQCCKTSTDIWNYFVQQLLINYYLRLV